MSVSQTSCEIELDRAPELRPRGVLVYWDFADGGTGQHRAAIRTTAFQGKYQQ